MKIINTNLQDVVILQPNIYGDHRGYFMESYNQKVFEQLGLKYNFVQDNQSLSRNVGTIRGLHFQTNPRAQTKLVRCVKGAIYDVAVDVRKGSPTFGKWVGVILSEYNNRQLLIPKGFAHGFCTLVPDCIVSYKVDEFYSPDHDGGILWNDPELDIDWPTSSPILSEKDSKLPTLSEAKLNFIYEK